MNVEGNIVRQGSELRNENYHLQFLFFMVIIKSLVHIVGKIMLID